MITYDLVMVAVLAVATILGAFKGMAWQIASVASLVLSYIAAFRFADQVAPLVSAQAPWNKFLAMLVIYLVTSAGIWILFRFVSRLIDRVQLREFDRQIGGLVGFAKGVLLCVVITFFAVTLSQNSRDLVLQSRSGGYIARLLHDATPIMPREMRQVLGPYIDRLNRGLDPRIPSSGTAATPAPLFDAPAVLSPIPDPFAAPVQTMPLPATPPAARIGRDPSSPTPY